MNALMISCKKATELTEKRIHFGLTLSESFQWRMHTAMCSACRLYSKQSAFIERTIEKKVSDDSHTPVVSDTDAQKLIKKILKE